MYKSEFNIITATDSYKCSHYQQYPPDTAYVYSYFESRGGKHMEICFFGLQIFIKKYLVGQVITQEKITEAEEELKLHFGNDYVFPKHLWEHILHKHKGRLPIKIKAVPEGTCLPYKNVLFTMVNTDPECYWLTNYLETLLVQVWYPMTVATNSREQKKILLKALETTGTPEDIGFKLHDFGYRGVSSNESASHGGAAHLTQFLGTDTLASLKLCREIYGEEMAGFSIPASEHSTMTSWGKEGESEAYGNMLKQYPKGLVACVSDSWDIINAIKIWGTDHKESIMNREGTLVIRPDSGDPKTVLLAMFEEAEKYFPVTTNSKGFKVFPPQLRFIQGDGITFESLKDITEFLQEKGWSLDNIAFGSGGGLLQKLDRDTQKCAFKCSLIIKKNGEKVHVYKDPITDPGKKSKKGYLTLHLNKNGKYETKSDGNHNFETDIMKDVFCNGDLIIDQKLSEIRERCKIN